MTATATSGGPADTASAERSAVVDACVFHEWGSASDLAPYLRAGWRELLTSFPARDVGPAPLYTNPMGGKLDAAYPSAGRVGLELQTFKEQVLDAWSPSRVVLGYDESILMTASANVHARKS